MPDYLPQEILLQIFHKLPNKSIGRCMCVCKYWLSIIKNPTFISTHLNQIITSPKKQDPLFLFSTCSKEEHRIRYSLHYDNEEFSKYMELESHPVFNDQSFSIVGSCNGLVCLMHDLYTYNYSFVLWNPFVRKAITLPKPNVTFESHGPFEALAGFGFDYFAKDYKVVRVFRLLDYEGSRNDIDEDDSIEVEIYSLKANSWKRVADKAPNCVIVERGSQAFVNGAVHWIATRRDHENGESCNLIVALDVGTEHFREIALPVCLADGNPMFLSVLAYKDASVAAIRRDYCGFKDSEIWVLNDYGEGDSWAKLLTIGRCGGGLPRALSFTGCGEVLFELNEGDIIAVDPECLMVRGIGIGGVRGYSLVDRVVESIVLLDY